MPRHYKRKTQPIAKETLKLALEAIKERNLGLRKAAELFKIPKSTLHDYSKGTLSENIKGGQLSIPLDSELQLVECLKIKAKWGFGESIDEVKKHVQQFVAINKSSETDLGQYLRKYNKFTNNMPGKDWMISFMRRHQLSAKCPSTLEKSRKSAASDPNIIYGYYDNVEGELIRLKISNRPECIWNIDETSLFIDPRKVKVVAPKGEKASRTTATSGREAISIMAGISAAGEFLSPLIIFQGKNLQSTWRGRKAYKGTEYAVSEKGWMTSEIFLSWFNKFCELYTQRPLLLVYDGHSTHLTSAVIIKAREEGISIIKLPPHTTDRLQPLDVCCFKPLKSKWDKALAEWTNENLARKLTKSDFADLVGEVWPQVFTPPLIIKSFKKTGLYPVNRLCYPENVFQPNLLTVYKRLQPLTEQHDVEPRMATPRKEPEPIEPQTSTPMSNNQCRNLSSSFEQIMSDRATYSSSRALYNEPSTSNTPAPKRRRINPQSRVITDDEFLEEIITIENKRAKPGKKCSKPASNPPKQTPSNKQKDASSSDDADEQSDKDSDTEEEEEEEEEEDQRKMIVNFSIKNYKNIKPCVDEYYAVHFAKNCYIGRVVGLNDGKVTIKYLERKADNKYFWPIHDDTDEVEAETLICGPITIYGTFPFTIYGKDKAFLDYMKAKKGNFI